MKTPRATLISLLLGPLAVGAAALAPAAPPKSRLGGKAVSTVIYPPQELPLRFNHALHLGQEGVDCETCHREAAASESSLDNLIPAEASCARCHPIDRAAPEREVEPGTPAARCDACHIGFDAETGRVARVRIPRPNLKFSHKVHAGRGIDCRRCHGDLGAEGVELATRAQLPRMKLCLECHDGRRAPDECTACHLADPGGFVRTEYDSGRLAPSGALRGAAHTLDFRESHAFAAQNDEQYCQSCHRKEFCVDCHDGVVKPLDFHAGDYISIHPVEARRNQPECSGCHRLQTFCVGCHSRSGVSPDGRGTEFGPLGTDKERPFHPSGWVEYGPSLLEGPESRGANHHAFQAQRNIRQCVACHRESFCRRCHTAQPGGPRINPHPNGWLGSRRCEALRRRAKRMCLRCHVDSVEVDCNRPAR